jgi:hypothetical protein
VIVIVTPTPQPILPASGRRLRPAAVGKLGGLYGSIGRYPKYPLRRTSVSVFELQQANCLVNLTYSQARWPICLNPPLTPRPTTPVTPSPTPTRTGTPVRPEIFSAVSQDKQTLMIGRYFEADDPTFGVALVEEPAAGYHPG